MDMQDFLTFVKHLSEMPNVDVIKENNIMLCDALTQIKNEALLLVDQYEAEVKTEQKTH